MLNVSAKIVGEFRNAVRLFLCQTDSSNEISSSGKYKNISSPIYVSQLYDDSFMLHGIDSTSFAFVDQTCQTFCTVAYCLVFYCDT
jgi:hypothetical protein